MEGKKVLRLIISLVLFIFLISCGPKAQVPLQKTETISAPKIEQSVSREAAEWGKLLSLAKKEGRLSVYSVANGELRVALIKKLREKFSLDLEMVTGRSGELTTRILNERKAGIYYADVYMGGGGGLINELKPHGVFDPINPQLFLPEVLDPKVWWGGELIYVDKDRIAVAMTANPSSPLTINTNLVGKEEIKSYLDLLNPKWKGKMILNDPTTTGNGQFWFAVTSSRIMNLDYMRRLAQMDLTISRDQRLQIEWLSHGKFYLVIGGQASTVQQFAGEGAPIMLITPREGTHINSSSGNIAIMNKAPHPNAAKLFINWLLTREGQLIFSGATGFQSARLDVPSDHLDSDKVRKPGVNYFNSSTEEFIKTLPEYAKIAGEIFGPLMR